MRNFFIASIFCQTANAAEDCSEVKGFDSILDNRQLEYLVVGELHGTAQIPAVFGSLVCSALRSGKKVLVGLEQEEAMSPALAAFIGSASRESDEELFLRETAWGAMPFDRQDGRQSKAMLDLIRKLRDLKSEYPVLDVVAFSRPPVVTNGNFDIGSYEAGMADSLLEASRRHGSELTMVLVGNAHSIKIKPDSSYAFMAVHLPAESTISLRASYSDGNAWNCTESGCGVHEVPARDFGDEIEIVPDSTAFFGHDGYLNVGSITASVPVDYGD